jgi:hypothetical protein
MKEKKTSHDNPWKLLAHLKPNNYTLLNGFLLTSSLESRWKCQQQLSSKWLFNFEHVATIFTKFRDKESMVMGLEGLIHQIHCRSMGAIASRGFLGHSSPRRSNHVTKKKTQLSLPFVASYFGLLSMFLRF